MPTQAVAMRYEKLGKVALVLSLCASLLFACCFAELSHTLRTCYSCTFHPIIEWAMQWLVVPALFISPLLLLMSLIIGMTALIKNKGRNRSALCGVLISAIALLFIAFVLAHGILP